MDRNPAESLEMDKIQIKNLQLETEYLKCAMLANPHHLATQANLWISNVDFSYPEFSLLFNLHIAEF